MIRCTIVALLLAWPLSGATKTSGTETARAALLRADAEWAELAASGKDLERIVSFWTDDAAIYPPRAAAVVGKEAIRAYVAESLEVPGFSITWKPSHAVVAASGDVGYTTGTNAITFPDSRGQLATAYGRYLTVWRKDADGRWRCVLDFWNEAPAAPGSGENQRE